MLASTASIVIVYEDGTEKQMEYATTCQYLSELLLEKELVTGYASQEYGFTIESVDGIMLNWATDGAYWALYEGEEYANNHSNRCQELNQTGFFQLGSPFLI